jgi:hypothetical protein
VEQEHQRLEDRLRALDEEVARVRHELIWRKREVRPGYAPIGLSELEQRFLELSDEFTDTWRRWSTLAKELDSAG